MKKSTSFILLLIIASVITLSQIGKVYAGVNIYIRADGSVDPATAPILRNGNGYTLTGNVSSSIVIQKDDIVLDGAGYWINGTEAENTEAIELSGRKDV